MSVAGQSFPNLAEFCKQILATGKVCLNHRFRAGCAATHGGPLCPKRPSPLCPPRPRFERPARGGSPSTCAFASTRADGFIGAPIGTAKPLTYLAAFQEAEPYLGLPAHAFKLVSWLVRQTRPQDWERGSRPIAWPSARRQQEFLGLSPAGVKNLNRVLFEAGLFVIRDNEQGKR
jgi:Replication protein C N-terminal domain